MTRRVIAVNLGWFGLSMAGDGIPSVLLPNRLLSAGMGSASSLGLTTLVALTIAAAVQPVAGAWSDRIGRWPVIALGCAVAVAGLLMLLDISLIAVGAVVALSGVSIAQAGHQPLAADWIAASWRGRASGVKGALDVGGAFLGFLLLAAVLGQGNPLGAAVVLGIALVAPFAVGRALLSARPDPGGEPPRRTSTKSHPPGLAMLVIARFLFLLAIFAVGRFLLLFIADRFDLTADAAAERAGLVLALLALLTAASSIPAGWLADRVGRRALMMAGAILACCGIGLLPAASTVSGLLVIGCLIALGSGAFGAGSWALLTDLTSSTDSGRLMGVANLGTAGAAAAAGGFGLLIDAGNRWQAMGGYTAAFAVAAALALAGGLISWRLASAAAAHPPFPSEVPS